MNKVVREHYPADLLPEELRRDFQPGAHVTITISAEEEEPHETLSLDELFALRKPPFRSGEEIDRELRRQRDEWDD
jgi:hypothetical protein